MRSDFRRRTGTIKRVRSKRPRFAFEAEWPDVAQGGRASIALFRVKGCKGSRYKLRRVATYRGRFGAKRLRLKIRRPRRVGYYLGLRVLRHALPARGRRSQPGAAAGAPWPRRVRQPARVPRLPGLPAVVDIRPVDPAHPDGLLCIRSYFAELDRRSDSGFDPAQGISAEPHELRPPAGLFLVAYLRSEPVGCGAVKHHDDAPSEIKRMWVAEAARGLGIGRRLLAELEASAAESGARAVRLETNRALTEAIALYRSAGYVEVPAFNDEPFAHHWFEKRLE